MKEQNNAGISTASILRSDFETPEGYDALQQEFDEKFINSIEIALSDKYEDLAYELAKCGNATKAYLKTHPDSKATRKTISERVCRLLKYHPEIRQRAVQIRMTLKSKKIASLEEALIIKSEIARDKKVNAADRNKATKDIIDFHMEKRGKKLNVDLKGNITNSLEKGAISGIAELLAAAKQG